MIMCEYPEQMDAYYLYSKAAGLEQLTDDDHIDRLNANDMLLQNYAEFLVPDLEKATDFPSPSLMENDATGFCSQFENVIFPERRKNMIQPL